MSADPRKAGLLQSLLQITPAAALAQLLHIGTGVMIGILVRDMIERYRQASVPVVGPGTPPPAMLIGAGATRTWRLTHGVITAVEIAEQGLALRVDGEAVYTLVDEDGSVDVPDDDPASWVVLPVPAAESAAELVWRWHQEQTSVRVEVHWRVDENEEAMISSMRVRGADGHEVVVTLADEQVG